MWLGLVVGVGCGPARSPGSTDDAGPAGGDPSDASADSEGGADASTPDGGTTPSGSCALPPSCRGTRPDPGARASWQRPLTTRIAVASGAPRHRGRDLILRPDDPQWALAKFAYGAADDDLQGERVDVWLQRECSGAWEHLGTATTSNDGDNATAYGVEDTGGWVFFRIPDAARLGVGRHRVHFVVKGDLSTTDQLIEVVAPGARFVVTDVDGTLTESEYAEVTAVVGLGSPEVHPGAPEALAALASRGYRILYLTARPHWLSTRTHEWLVERNLPPGLVHTTLSKVGALNEAAAEYKRDELAALTETIGRPIDYGIGNKESDAAAYLEAGIDPSRRLLFRLDGDAMGGVIFDDYRDLIAPFEALPLVCE